MMIKKTLVYMAYVIYLVSWPNCSVGESRNRFSIRGQHSSTRHFKKRNLRSYIASESIIPFEGIRLKVMLTIGILGSTVCALYLKDIVDTRYSKRANVSHEENLNLHSYNKSRKVRFIVDKSTKQVIILYEKNLNLHITEDLAWFSEGKNIAFIGKRKLKKTKEMECSICQEAGFSSPTNKSSCGYLCVASQNKHGFCLSCLARALSYRHACPNCRAGFFKENVSRAQRICKQVSGEDQKTIIQHIQSLLMNNSNTRTPDIKKVLDQHNEEIKKEITEEIVSYMQSGYGISDRLANQIASYYDIVPDFNSVKDIVKATVKEFVKDKQLGLQQLERNEVANFCALCDSLDMYADFIEINL